MAFTNKHNIDLTMAVFLAHHDYDGINKDNAISVTTLLRPIKEIILSNRLPEDSGSIDVSSRIASCLGTAVHNAIEHAWKSNPQELLKQLGQPKAVYETVRINPPDADDDYFNVFIEQRSQKEIDGFIINGKYDFVVDGVVEDVKTTSTYSWTNRVNDEKYKLQGSLYRWLNPEIAHEPYMKIHFVFTDWSKLESIKKPKEYPPLRIMTKQFTTLSIGDTENWVRAKLREIKSYWDKPQDALPVCSPSDLWQGNPVYKYYKTGNVEGRATRVCDTPAEADRVRRENGGMGIVLPVYGKPKACKYCSALQICNQGQNYVRTGQIDLDD